MYIGEFLFSVYALFTGQWWLLFLTMFKSGIFTLVGSGISVLTGMGVKIAHDVSPRNEEHPAVQSTEGLHVLVKFLQAMLRGVILFKAFSQAWYNVHKVVEEGRPAEKRVTDLVKALLWIIAIPLTIFIDLATITDLFRPVLVSLGLKDAFDRVFKESSRDEVEKEKVKLEREKFEHQKKKDEILLTAERDRLKVQKEVADTSSSKATAFDAQVAYNYINNSNPYVQEQGWEMILVNKGWTGDALAREINKRVRNNSSGIGFVAGPTLNPSNNNNNNTNELKEDKDREDPIIEQGFGLGMKKAWRNFIGAAKNPNPLWVGLISLVIIAIIVIIVYFKRDRKVVKRRELKKQLNKKLNNKKSKNTKTEGHGAAAETKDASTKGWEEWKTETLYVFGKPRDPVEGHDLEDDYDYGLAWASLMDTADSTEKKRFSTYSKNWSNKRLKGFNAFKAEKSEGKSVQTKKTEKTEEKQPEKAPEKVSTETEVKKDVPKQGVKEEASAKTHQCTCGKKFTENGLKCHQGFMRSRGTPCVAEEGKQKHGKTGKGYQNEKKKHQSKQEKQQKKNEYSRQNRDRKEDNKKLGRSKEYLDAKEQERRAIAEEIKNSEDSWHKQQLEDELRELERAINEYSKIKGEGMSAGASTSKGVPIGKNITVSCNGAHGQGWATSNLIFINTHVLRLLKDAGRVFTVRSGDRELPSITLEEFKEFRGKRDLVYAKYNHPGIEQIQLKSYSSQTPEVGQKLKLVVAGKHVQDAEVTKVDGITIETIGTNTADGDSGSQLFDDQGRLVAYHRAFNKESKVNIAETVVGLIDEIRKITVFVPRPVEDVAKN